MNKPLKIVSEAFATKFRSKLKHNWILKSYSTLLHNFYITTPSDFLRLEPSMTKVCSKLFCEEIFEKLDSNL
jgi:hypothetical protein